MRTTDCLSSKTRRLGGAQFSGGSAFGSAPGISGFDGFKTWLEGQGVIIDGGGFGFSTEKRDYCGSGFTSGVPDKPLGHNFSDACKLHDMLYSVLNGPHGKAIADAMFLSAMLDWCDKNAPGDQSCRKMAYAYAAGVILFGGPAYVFARPGR